MIVVLSLNTAVDRIMVIPGLRPGEVFRAEESHAYAGGKGLNVARVVRQLGLPVRIIGLLGGIPSPFIQAECDRMGIETGWVAIEAESRTCVIAVDPQASQTVLNEPGPEIRPDEVDRLAEAIRAATSLGDLLCISGSAPPGVPEDFYRDVVIEQQSRGVRVLVDVSGPPLRLAWEARPWAVKPNLDEARAAFGTYGDGLAVALTLAERAEHVLVTAGEKGVWYASGGSVRAYHPPPIVAVNAVGSGDALAAGFLAGIQADMAPEEAVMQGVACGAANAMRLEPGIGSRDQVARLLEGSISAPLETHGKEPAPPR